MDGPFIPGKFYNRLCIRACWPDGDSRPQWWPVHGPMHEDREFINFPHYHYHVDWRFLIRDQREKAIGPCRLPAIYNIPISAVMLSEDPRQTAMLSDRPKDDPLRPQYAQTKKRRYHGIPWPSTEQIPTARWYDKLAAAYRDQKLKPGLVCPHRGAELAGIPPQEGIIICPMHGLQWRADTGELHIP